MTVHLHGHKFQIVGKQDDVTADDMTINEQQANPIRRDVVQIPSGGSATLRFVVDNPGVWLFHVRFPSCFGHLMRRC